MGKLNTKLFITYWIGLTYSGTFVFPFPTGILLAVIFLMITIKGNFDL